MRQIGLHLRLTHSFFDAVDYALALKMPTFQSFLLDQVHKKCICLNTQSIDKFHALKGSFESFFIHASYWINLANLTSVGKRALCRELKLTNKLEATGIIFHPGSASGLGDRTLGLEAVIRELNKMHRLYPNVTTILENTVHARMTIGSDFEDFYYIRQRLDFPEKVAFCVDTAHAYTYGYDIKGAHGQQRFIDLLEETIGIKNIALLHLNDAFHELESRIDKHEALGSGTIGIDALKSFALESRLARIPIIVELPLLSAEQEQKTLQEVRNWHS